MFRSSSGTAVYYLCCTPDAGESVYSPPSVVYQPLPLTPQTQQPSFTIAGLYIIVHLTLRHHEVSSLLFLPCIFLVVLRVVAHSVQANPNRASDFVEAMEGLPKLASASHVPSCDVDCERSPREQTQCCRAHGRGGGSCTVPPRQMWCYDD
ncbi:hypothetical protein BV898_02749 [Hypsibius exemplaris]|uniref:Uncharacterized protein n=1 Tax=Hypsibius exemplaris TaxID=2072580 RepID=A0A1W0X7E6_HYPEX|nr:hypothetical protein BV898_02749 [Hypsibius exemplaris]